MDKFHLIDQLYKEHALDLEAYAFLIANQDAELRGYARERAVSLRKEVYGNKVFTRGLIEFTNICKNNCYYCGIRKGNAACHRYRLSPEEIYACVDAGYDMGYRTFVLQGGEDPYFTDERICSILRTMKEMHPDAAITLSIGEKSRESYEAYFQAGAERYLLRHETASESLYGALHPKEMSFQNRMRCLRDLKEIGYQVGAGFMVESPGQTVEDLALDLKFVETFQPEMCGIGPYITHKDTPFRNCASGSLELTCFLLSLLRMISPTLLLPATTALGTIHPTGREQGIQAGANVVMPNLSPVTVRKDYSLYDNKICTGEEAAECRGCLGQRMQAIGYELVVGRGDPAGFPRES